LILNQWVELVVISIQSHGRRLAPPDENGSPRVILRGKRKFIVMGAAGVAGVVAAGAAYAMWSANGTGSGTATARNAVGITVTAATGTADLYPGFSGGDLSFTLANPNPYPVTFTAMTPGTITSSNSGACAASNLTVTSATGLSIVVPAGATATSGTIVDVATLSSGALDGCQGISFTVPVTLTGSQTP
jgi:hypothetical protein